MLPYDREKGHAVVDRLRAIAAAHNATPAQVALAWVLSKSAVTSVLIGASKMEQLEDNLGAVNLELSAEDVHELNELTAPAKPYPNWFSERVVDVPVRDALAGTQALQGTT
jgi:aryl-alcohol dehydrogenase-like predicted oxidoreductase